MSEQIFDRLKAFIIKETAVHDEEITMDTQIEHDLGITGDDAVDFMIAYGKAFNVDVSNFMAGDYFSGEGGSLLSTIIGAFTGKKESQKKALTVGHLEKGITSGRLDEEVMNG